MSTENICPFPEMLDLWSRKESTWSQTKESMQKTELIFGGIKRAESRLTNGSFLGCLCSTSILKSLAFVCFFPRSQGMVGFSVTWEGKVRYQKIGAKGSP